MVYQFIQVETLVCDNCGRAANLVKNQPEQSVYGEWSEWDMFIDNLKKSGWQFINQDSNESESESEIVACSEECIRILKEKERLLVKKIVRHQ